MKRLLGLNFLLLSSLFFGQTEKFVIQGFVIDEKDLLPISGATVYLQSLNLGFTTNEAGEFSFKLPVGEYRIFISYLGYESVNLVLNVSESDINTMVVMKPEDNILDEVIVSVDREYEKVKKSTLGLHRVSVQDIKKVPGILGEADVLRSLMVLPGITNAGEGQSGLNIRGGSTDQNLLLLDRGVLFNSSHIFGFYSVINPDVVQEVYVYKGGIPARYGGRLSSVIDIRQKKGNEQDYIFSGGIGLLASRGLLEGPLVKDKGSFLVSGRTAYGHELLKIISEHHKQHKLFFYDLNSRLKYNFNDRHSINVSAYKGYDVFEVEQSFENFYGNTLLTVDWKSISESSRETNVLFSYSLYENGLGMDFLGVSWKSRMNNYNLQYDSQQILNEDIKLRYGLATNYHNFYPGSIRSNIEESSIRNIELDQKHALENGGYVEVERTNESKIGLNLGLRISQFYRFGNQTVNIYENSNPIRYNEFLQIYQKAEPIGERFYSYWEKMSNYYGFEPRVSLSYNLRKNKIIKLGYNRMIQYLHLLSNTQSPTPLDVWTLSDQYLKPQKSDQFTLGYFRNEKQKKSSLSIEGFYKLFHNRLDFIDGAEIVANNNIEQTVLQGIGRSYGLELLLQKCFGDLSANISYTLSRAEQKTSGRTNTEPGINSGEWYNSPFDKTHDLSVILEYKISESLSINGLFTYQTGQPVTLPNGRYEYMGVSIPTFESRNASRLSSYNRLDFSLHYHPLKSKQKKWKSEWVLGIYNVYNKMNAASYSYRQNSYSGAGEVVKFSVFGIVPGITYNFRY